MAGKSSNITENMLQKLIIRYFQKEKMSAVFSVINSRNQYGSIDYYISNL